MKINTILFFSIIIFSLTALAKSTGITVRVLANDSKFIGNSMGGVEIVIKDIKNKNILAKGTTTGNTGDTHLLMKEPRKRYDLIATPKSAAFKTNIDLKVPTKVLIAAKGPLNSDDQQEVSVSMWLFPGKHLNEGNGILLKLPGFSLTPQPLTQKPELGKPIKAHLTIKMMCGCPIKPEGIWDSNKIKIWAVVKRNREIILQKPLVYNSISDFKLNFTPRKEGSYSIVFMAFDSRTANTGLGQLNFKIER